MPNIKEFYMGIDGECTFEYDNGSTKIVDLAEVGGTSAPVAITADTTLTTALHNGKILRLDASRTLSADGLGTEYSCIIEIPVGATLSVDPTGTTTIQDTATPAGSASTRTRTQVNNPSGVILKSTGVANVLSLSGT